MLSVGRGGRTPWRCEKNIVSSSTKLWKKYRALQYVEHFHMVTSLLNIIWWFVCLFQQRREDRVWGDVVVSLTCVFVLWISVFDFFYKLLYPMCKQSVLYILLLQKSKTETRRHETKVLVPGHRVDWRTGVDYKHNLWVIYTQRQAFVVPMGTETVREKGDSQREGNKNR